MTSRLIDVREPFEFRGGYIEGSELVPLRTLRDTAVQWDRNQALTLVCRSGHRAEAARTQLRSLGFRNVDVLTGGVQLWKSQGKPLVKPMGSQTQPSRWHTLFFAAALVVCLLLARSVSEWFLLPVGFLAVRLIRAWFPGAFGCCALPQAPNNRNEQ